MSGSEDLLPICVYHDISSKVYPVRQQNATSPPPAVALWQANLAKAGQHRLAARGITQSGPLPVCHYALDWPSPEILEDCAPKFKTAASFGDLRLVSKQVEPTPFKTSYGQKRRRLENGLREPNKIGATSRAGYI
ncbi:uncharacterized protein TRIREDRAFT_104867 [Trichoderma reesei QM6a]|uniref:Predicted protein n=2 Tax=Hypocrea jecorina TaxID=51453 RepID=G0RCS9_HYPJQ|nr:uncharacterized protein TRIREDRAFT_104867 [Trichoderma reesei QM6a]EGR50856.1 predicted protein [Trichoderma reesei QM6a]ETS05661.1 hypothetical protein M419DRAFT_70350 [Trichoderma reesei RUT C-30]